MKTNYFAFFSLLFSLFSCFVFAQSNDQVKLSEYLWRQAVGGVVIGKPSVHPQSLVAALDSGIVKAYSGSGELLWSYSVRSGLWPYVTQSREGLSFICSTDGSLIAINRSGRELWKANAGGALSGPIVTGWDGRLFVPAAGKISCYTSSGTLLWANELGSGISAGPILDQNGCILLALENGSFIRITPFGGLISWKLPSVPVILVPTGNDILAMYGNGNILRVDSSAKNSAPLPFHNLGARPLAAADRGGRTAVFLANGQMLLLSGNEGKVLWTANSFIRLRSNEEKAELIFDQRGIYLLCASGAAGFSANGNTRWFANLENASGIPAFGDDGVLYSGGKDWVLNAWKIEDRTLDQKYNLYGPAPQAVYGTGNPPPSIFPYSTGRFNETLVKRELEIIQTGIASGSVGGNEMDWVAYLMETADGGYWPISNSRVPKAMISHRILALQLLSRMGSIETIPWLVSFFKRESEPHVKIAAALAIGGIGMDPDGKAIQEFMSAVRSGNPIRDEQLFINIAIATGALCRFSGPPLYDMGFQLLQQLDNPRQAYLVRRQAQHELNTLR